ncbi:SIR2 family protein [Candidatus Enterovibrio escicola]|uniref:SIR2 family protein n=1 Tax=Candidatus Enterovibrio escicola TaxID=1927127 RepID=UPI001237B013|nr:SIR2 family protein [Candidatus Enterovibrio escacola]
MGFDDEIEIFIKDYVKDLHEGTASIFAGAGLSIPAGFVNWSDSMEEFARDLGLDIKMESDFVLLAQFHINENRNRTKINRKIIEEFTEETENHRIIARLPVSSIWTTNYDELIEKTFLKQGKVTDTKHNIKQLLCNKPKRDVVIYKMHGDVSNPSDAIISKEQYESYHQTHEPFINALTGELITKTFLFIGFSFTDPNLDYVLSRLNFRFREEKRLHYCIVKRHVLGDGLNPDQASLDYNTKKHSLIINDLKRYGIKTLLVNDYQEITAILHEIESRYKKRTIFISGSAEVYDPYTRSDAVNFIHDMSKQLIKENFRLINGFGWGVGSSIINGALEAIYSNPLKYSELQLVLRPFPQFRTESEELSELWEEYRNKMISLSGISLFVFGNKNENNEIIKAKGVIREFEISADLGNIIIPIACTGHASEIIYNTIIDSIHKYYSNPLEAKSAKSYLEQLADCNTPLKAKVPILINFIKTLTK